MHSNPSDRHPARPSPERAGGAFRYLACLLVALAPSLFLHVDSALSATNPALAPPVPAGNNPAGARLNAVTIQAAKARKELERRVDHYVVSSVVTYLHDSLVRWNTPVCPLAAGLPRDMGEFILGRISQIATAAHVSLAGEHCSANLYIIAAPYPDQLLQKWRARNPRMYSLCNGWWTSARRRA